MGAKCRETLEQKSGVDEGAWVEKSHVIYFSGIYSGAEVDITPAPEAAKVGKI